MTARRPSVSVVIPCFRYGHFLEGCVRSAIDQPGVDVRVLIIDDASPDDSADVARRLAAENDRVEVWVHPANRGHIATYNEGLLEWADGDYSVLISADDLIAPGALGRAAAVLEANPNVGFVYGHAVDWIDGQPLPPARTELTGTNLWAGAEWLKIVCGLAHSVVSSPEVVVRTELQQRVGGYRADLPHSGDAEMWMRFAVHGDVGFLKGVDQAYYRKHGSNMTIERVPIVDLRQRRAAYDAIFDAYTEQIPNGPRLRRQVERTLAKEALWEVCRAYDRRRMESTPIDELVAFARDVYPEIERLPEYWGVRWRRRVGADKAPYFQPLVLSAVRRRAWHEYWTRRWEREGI